MKKSSRGVSCHLGSGRPRVLAIEHLEQRRLLASSGVYPLASLSAISDDLGAAATAGSGEIHGTKWSDLDADGVWDEGEPGLAGVTIYLDTNGNGQLDLDQDQAPLEPTAVTMSDNPATPGVDETGTYQFTGLAAGTYTVAEVVPAAYESTYPTGTGSLTLVQMIRAREEGVGGLTKARPIAVSPDGRHVYSVGTETGAVTALRRDTEAGELTFIQTLWNGQDGVDGLRGANSVVISSDGRHIYVAGTMDNAVAVFRRDAATGELTFVQALKDDSLEGVDGLGQVMSIVLSPDGLHLYTAAEGDDAVGLFQRNVATGELTFVQVLKDGVDGVDGLDGATSVMVSRDGRHVYAGGSDEFGVAIFRRNTATGELTFLQMLELGNYPFHAIGRANWIADSPDGHVYIVGFGAMGVLSRDVATGELTFIESVVDKSKSYVHRPAFGHGGRIFISTSNWMDPAVVVLGPNEATDKLEVVEFVEHADDPDVLYLLNSPVLSPDGNQVYIPGKYGVFVFQPHFSFAEPGEHTVELAAGQIIQGVDFGNHTNAAPENVIPGAQNTEMNTTKVFSPADGNPVYIADPDAGNAAVEVTLSAENGTISMARTPGLAFTVGDGSDDAAVTFTGKIDAINGALDGMSFTPAAGFLGQAGLQIATNDLGHSRPGGAKSDTDAVTINVDGAGAANDPPQIAAPGSQSMERETELSFSVLAGNALSVSDPDAGWMPVEVALESTHGTITLSTTSGLTFTAGDGAEDAAMTFTGTIPDVNTALDGMRFSPVGGYTGPARIEISASDLGHSGPGNPLTDSDEVAVTVLAWSGQIHGTNWSDLNSDGVRDDGEPGIAGVTVYLDTNGNGQLDLDQNQQPLEPVAVTAADNPATPDVDETGTYQFTGLPSGTYRLGEIVPEGYEPTFPAGVEPLTPVDIFGPDPRVSSVYDSMNSITVSPDGRHAYATSSLEDSAHLFRRDGVTGELTYVKMIKDGLDRVDGLDGARAIVVSPDGAHVYVAGEDDDALAVFRRDAVTGELAFVEVYKDGQGGVDGLDGARSITVSPDGKHLYAAGHEDDALAVFERDAISGKLTFVEMTGGLSYAMCVAMSPDGSHVYTLSKVDVFRAVTAYHRDVTTGSLTRVQRVDADAFTGLWGATSIVVSPDGFNLYAAGSSIIGVLGRDVATGRLSDFGFESVRNGATSVAVNPNGRYVYVINDDPSFSGDDAEDITVFERDATGRLTLAGVFWDEPGVSKGNGEPHSLTVSPDGRHVYAAYPRGPLPETRVVAVRQHHRFAQPGLHEVTLAVGRIIENIDFGSYTNGPPENTVPGVQTIEKNIQLVFSAANGNAVSVTDRDGASIPAEVTLTANQGSITLSDIGGLAFSVGDGTADSTVTFMGTIRAVNAARDGMRFTPAIDFLGSAGIQITTDDLGHARPGGAKSDTDAISLVVQAPAVTDLGPLDYLEMPGQDPSVGTIGYRLATTHEALVTIEASFTGGPDDVQLKLYDADPIYDTTLQPLAVSALVDGKQRIDYPADSAGQTYYFTIAGSATSADLLLANLVQQQGSTVTVHGTAADDTFGFDASASRTVTINAVRYEFENAEARSVTFDGGAGMDVVIMDDSAGDEVLTAQPTHAVLSNADPTGGFTVTVDGFETMHVYARSGGTDRAYLYDSNKNDKFKSEPAKNYAKMYGGQMYNWGKFFDVVEAYSSGQNDLARVFDTAANDTFLGQKDASRMTTADPGVLDVGVHNFRRVIAYANQGGVDEATLKDSVLKDEFHGKSHKSTIFDADTDGSVYEITARRFDHVYADGSQGDEYDKAKLWGTPDNDRVEAEDDVARFWSQGTTPRLLYEVAAFEFVKIRASTGGGDTSDVTDPLAFQLAFEDGWDE